MARRGVWSKLAGGPRGQMDLGAEQAGVY